MKKVLIILISANAFSVSAQTVTDSVNTTIGDFILVTSEQAGASAVYSEENISTSDGGNGEFVAVNSNARMLLTPVVSVNMQISVMPNPSSGATELSVTGMSGTAAVVVTNVLGQTVYSSNTVVDGSAKIFLPSQLWESGNYFVVVSNGQDVKSEKLVVE
jgi:hypothetical protein